MEKLSVVILEDDKSTTFILQNMLEKMYGNILHQAGTSTNVKDGIQLILEKKPDLVFLDVSLADKNGFEIFRELKIVNFDTIITTGNSSHALEAFKINALDFLLKPVNAEALDQSIKKFISKKLTKLSNQPQKIIITTPNGLLNVYIKDILYCEANGNNSIIYYTNNTNQQISRSLKDLEDILGKNGFFRVQKSYLVNIEHIIEYSKAEGGFVVLRHAESKRIPVSKHVKDHLLELFEL